MTAVLTKTAIDAEIAKIGKGQRVVLNDDREAGLFVRIGERGAKWGVQVRTRGGQKTRVTLGKRRLDKAIADERVKLAMAAAECAGIPYENAPEEMPHWTVHDLRTSLRPMRRIVSGSTLPLPIGA